MLELDEGALNGARRRALLLLAAGGDPHRQLEPDARAVRALADELRVLAPGLSAALARLDADASGLERVRAGLERLGPDPYPWLALALLAEELADGPD